MEITSTEREKTLTSIRNLSNLLDNAITIPGTSIKIGLDSFVGLVPGIGDFGGFIFSTWIFIQAARLGVKKRTLAKLIKNMIIDTLVGAVPVLGDIFDIAWKSNARNMSLIEEDLNSQSEVQRRNGRQITLLILMVPLTAALFCVGLLLFLFSLLF